ncbi:MAG: DNA phosphorothioation-associated putative methyltransferase [Nostocaceae cyanobacterium]|nr:DNA phosphorothioation-associated putative methyltransferase [Nostocaceae cyanobacterium]
MALSSHTPQQGDLSQKSQPLWELDAIAQACERTAVGKLLPDAFYIHISGLHALDPLLQTYESRARTVAPQGKFATLVKFSISKPKISYLYYPEFDTEPHPALEASIQVDLETLEVNHRDYSTTDNPPVLHRKETFVTPEYPYYEEFAALTRAQQELGLLDNTRGIGTRRGWQQRLDFFGVEIQGHKLIKTATETDSEVFIPKIERHKAAILRHNLSRPVRLGLEAGLFTPNSTFFDYGCGHGGDVKRIAHQGYTSRGWDPYYAPEVEGTPADIVNIGYVINVIEDQQERREALINAWDLTRKVLLVSAQVLISDSNRGVVAYGDGVITSRNTFQKYYDQEELKVYIDQVLGVDAVPVALGVYFVFRDVAEAEYFRASRFRSRTTTPRVRSYNKRFEDYEELLTPLMLFMAERGRLPKKHELSQATAITDEFGSLNRAFQVILQATDPQDWEKISEKRRQDLIVYLGLLQFSQRPQFGKFAPELKEDIKGLFGSYKQACKSAEEMLYSIGDMEKIVECCQNSAIGKKFSNSLWVHISALESLDPLLRLYEGCARYTIGRLEEANVIKFHTKSPKISYLYYPNFDKEPHPLLYTSMKIDLRSLRVTYRDYDDDDNPPVLHYKDALVTPDYPLYEKFARLTRKEEDWGLLDDLPGITLLAGWRKCLVDHCATLKGYNLQWRKDADPYKLKALRAAVKTRARRRKAENIT